jgi:DNA-binding SARP family transcriptional activator
MAGVQRTLLQLDGIAVPSKDAAPCEQRREVLDGSFEATVKTALASAAPTAADRPVCTAGVLADTLELARSQGIVNFFGWRDAEMSRIAMAALEKGIQIEFVNRLVRERGLRPPAFVAALDTWPWRLRICTLGRFALFRDDAPLILGGKGQRKPIRLLQTLLALGGSGVSTEQLGEALWPDADSDATRRAFDTTLHRLRRLLDVDGVLIVENGRLSVDPQLAWVDVWALDALVNEASCRLRDADAHAGATSLTELLGPIQHLYSGPFLAEDSDELWVLGHRERLQQRVLGLLRDAGMRFENVGAWQDAISCYAWAIQIEPLAEAFYQKLITALNAQGCKAEALLTYERCREVMISNLGVVPSPKTIALHRRVLSSGSA